MKRLLALLMLMPILAMAEDFVKMGNMTMGSATAGTNTAVQGNLSVLNGAFIEKGLSVSNGNVNITGEFQTNGVALVLGGGTIADGSLTTNKSGAAMHDLYRPQTTVMLIHPSTSTVALIGDQSIEIVPFNYSPINPRGAADPANLRCYLNATGWWRQVLSGQIYHAGATYARSVSLFSSNGVQVSTNYTRSTPSDGTYSGSDHKRTFYYYVTNTSAWVKWAVTCNDSGDPTIYNNYVIEPMTMTIDYMGE